MQHTSVQHPSVQHPRMRLKSGAEVLVDCLINQGVKVGFGIPGESYLAVLDALYDVKTKLRFITTRHESGAAFMAEAYAKLSGEIGVCFVTRGPGATNASIGVHTAKQNSTPMIVFVGQIDNTMRHREAFQEIEYEVMFARIAKWVVEIDCAQRIPELVARAFTMAQQGRKGPVVVSLPENILTQKTNVKPCGKVIIPEPVADKKQIKEIMGVLKKAKNPIVVVGGVWSQAGKKALKKFVEQNHLPVVVAMRGQDILDNNSDSYCGEAGFGMPQFVRKKIEESDVILAINVRFGEILTDGYTVLNPKNFKKILIHCHRGMEEIGKILKTDIGVCGDHNDIAIELSKATRVKAPWKTKTEKSHKIWEQSLVAPKQPGELDMGEITQYLREKLPEDSIITTGAGNFAIWAGRHLAYKKNMRIIGTQSGAMGSGIPAAIAAKVKYPKRCVVCFTGDGDFQMSMMEMGTALQLGIGFVVLLVNNKMYGTIRLHQEREYPKRVSGTDIVNPDFVSIAKAYGWFARRVSKTEEFATAFEKARKEKNGGLIELMIDPEALSPHITVAQLRQKSK